MNVIDRNRLLKDGNYYKQLACFGFFFVIGVGVFLLQVIMALGTEQLILAIVVYGILVLFPFGYLLGLRKLFGVAKDIIRIKNRNFRVLEREVIDKHVVNNSSTKNDTQIIFSKEDGIWVSRKRSKEIKVGDICYVVYLDGDVDACAIYSKKKNVLTDDLENVLV